MSKLYTRISDEFDIENPTGVIVCGEFLEDTHSFTEQGYDTADYDAAPNVYEVLPTIDRFASEAQAVEAARKAGVVIFDTHDDIERAVKEGTFSGSWQKGDCHCLEEEPINRLVLESSAFREAVENAGYKGIRDVVAISNTQPELTMLWMPGTFELVGPVALVQVPEEDSPYHVRLAVPRPASVPGTPRM